MRKEIQRDDRHHPGVLQDEPPNQGFAIYIKTTSLKCVSSMKLHRNLGASQKAAWFLLHRPHDAMTAEKFRFDGSIATDEDFLCGSKDKHALKRMKAAGDSSSKAIVANVRDRAAKQVVARVVPNTPSFPGTGWCKTTPRGREADAHR